MMTSEQLIERWRPVSRPIQEAKSDSRRLLHARMLENQYKYTRTINGSVGAHFHCPDTSLLGENIVPGDIAAFTRQSLAMVDMIFEQIVFDQLVAVRPMDGPTALVHHQIFKQGDAGLFPEGTAFNSGLDPDYSDCPGESTSEACAAAKEVDYELTASTITAQCKRLTSQYTITAEQDLDSQYGLSLPDRLRTFMAREIAREIQGEILALLIANATTTVTWTKAAPAGSIYLSLDPKVYQETLFDAIQSADNGIFKSVDGYRGASWICADPDSLLYLEQLNSFSIHTDSNQARDRALEGDIERYSNKFGVANHRYDVWKMRWMSADTILLGLKGNDEESVGHIHATYVPIADLGMLRNPRTACVDIGVMSRQANVTTRPGLFAVVNLT